jgi:hypothetical protein
MPGGKLPDRYISTREAAALLGCSAASVETGLRNGTFPIGWAWNTTEDGRRGQWNYRIPRAALIAAIETGAIARGASA